MTPRILISIVLVAVSMSASAASALVCPSDCASKCSPTPPEPVTVSCQWNSGGCQNTNCEDYLIGICPTDACATLCTGAATCSTPCRAKSFGDCQFMTTCGEAGFTVPTCNANDGWADFGAPYTCCSGASSECSCQKQEYWDYSCGGTTTCDFTVTSTQTNKTGCTACDTNANDCVDVTCDLGGSEDCSFLTPKPDTTVCDTDGDGDLFCTPQECATGSCIAGTPPVCDDADPCTNDSCSGGACQFVDNGMCACAPGATRPYWTGNPAQQGVGRCTDGIETCNMAGTAWVVTTPEVLPQAERPDFVISGGEGAFCDLVDDDCNGTPGYVAYKYPTPLTGLVFQSDPLSSEVANALPVSATSVCQINSYECIAGAIFDILPAKVLPSVEICDTLDNDCDGAVDEGSNEVCDGIDNDCDGLIDEFPATQSCGANKSCYGSYCYDDCGFCTGSEICYVSDFRCDDPNNPCVNISCQVGDSCYQGTCFGDCTSDAMCDPANERCYGGNVCLDSTDPCVGVQCPQTQVCYQAGCFDPCDGLNPCVAPMQCWDGRCAVDPCDGVVCPLTESCFGGTCFRTCMLDQECDPNSYCYNGRCAPDPCDGIQCPLGDVCHAGVCAAACTVNGECPDVCIEAQANPNFCGTGDLCLGVVCGTEQTCFQGTCFDNCLNSLTCDPNELCFDNRCVDDDAPYCDGVLCAVNDACVSGTCFDTCTADANCDPNSYCYQGACVEDTCVGVNCVAGEACFRGVCFVECDAANPCVAPDGCFDGRCAPSACEAMAVNEILAYNTNHPFREAGYKLVANQRSTPWIYPRPFQDGSNDYKAWLGYGGSSITAPITAARRARVTFFLDSNEGSSPGEYVLYLSHGNTSGQPKAEAVWSMRFEDVDPDVIWMDDPDAEGHKETDSNPRHIVAAVTTDANETGGVAVGFLPADEAWNIRIDGSFQGAIDGWDLVNGETGAVYPLKIGEPLFIRSKDMPNAEQFSPEIGTVCNRENDKGICEVGTYLECKNFESICYATVAPWSVEVCDGLDNTCNGFVDNADPALEFPMVYWKQWGFSGFQVLPTYDDNKSVTSIINYTPVGPDDRLGYPDVTLPDGVAIQSTPDRVNVLAYRDLRTGIIYYGWTFGADSVTPSPYEEREIDMHVDAPWWGDLYGVYVAWYDDRREGDTDDKVLDDYDPDQDLAFKMYQPDRSGRTDSDAVFLGNDWTGEKMGMNVYLEDETDGPRTFDYALQRPTVGPKNLNFWNQNDAILKLRIVGRPAADTVCESPTATPTGCELSRYACVGGQTICQAAVDPACSTCFDIDADGYFGIDPVACPLGNDCDDENAAINPGAAEICNGVDDNCNGLIDRNNTGCPNGTAECGPQECGYAIACVCPADIPPSATRDCFCGEGLSQ